MTRKDEEEEEKEEEEEEEEEEEGENHRHLSDTTEKARRLYNWFLAHFISTPPKKFKKPTRHC